MANKYELRRRSLKESHGQRDSSYASTRPTATGDGKASPLPGTAGHKASPWVGIAVCCLLVSGVLAVFSQTVEHEFVNCDDNDYVVTNRHIQGGLTLSGVQWAVTQAHSANWHPLTWMSHMIDWQAFGKWDADRQRYVNSAPGGHHLVNVLLHAACAVLLFLILQEMSCSTWPSAMVAALFAIHPLRAESVAWVAERKDMLSGLFFLLTLAAYQAYAVRRFSWWRYGLVIISFALGLAAKPMLVTLPMVLLLLDFWPLQRIAPRRGGQSRGSLYRVLPRRVWLEKIPLLALTVGSCFLTIWAQHIVGAFKPLAFEYRLGNALVSYAAYIGQMFLPVDLVVQYVHPGPHLTLQDTLVPIAVLGSITLAVLWLGWRQRYLAVGWFWYVGMLVPVIGLVQVGAQARADRYTYLTQIGLFIMIAWGLSDLARTWRARSAFNAALAAAAIAALTAIAWLQTSYWRNSVTLWEHSVACQGDTNDFAHNEYGVALADAGRVDEAMEHYQKAFEINRLYLTPRTNYAGWLYKRGKSAEALKVCDEALEIDSEDFEAHFLRAIALHGTGNLDESIREFHTAIEKDPRRELAHNDLAEVLRMSGKLEEALTECRTALEINPELPEGHRAMAKILLAKNDLEGALKESQTALKLRPDDAQAQRELAEIQQMLSQFKVAKKPLVPPKP
jgi:protein O-mannosyl-transferase